MNDKERLLEILYANGGWFRFSELFFLIMTWDECVVLSFLMNASYVQKAWKNDGWFVFKVADFERRTRASEDKQRRIIKCLEEANRLESERRGLPAKRYFKINYGGISDELLYVDSQEQVPEISPEQQPEQTPANYPVKSPEHTTCKKNLRKNNTVPPRNEDGTDSVSSENSRNKEDQPYQSKVGFPLPQETTTSSSSNFDMRCATELGNAVQKNYQTSPGNDLRKWSVQFRLLRTNDGASKDLIKRVLKWYVDADWNDKFLPQAFSGESFRKKFFDKLVPAWKRSVGEETTFETENKILQKSARPFTDEEWVAHCEEQDRGELGLSQEAYIQYRKDWEEEHNEKYESPYV